MLGRTVAALSLTLANATSAEQLEALLKGHESVKSFRRMVGASGLLIKGSGFVGLPLPGLSPACMSTRGSKGLGFRVPGT